MSSLGVLEALGKPVGPLAVRLVIAALIEDVITEIMIIIGAGNWEGRERNCITGRCGDKRRNVRLCGEQNRYPP